MIPDYKSDQAGIDYNVFAASKDGQMQHKLILESCEKFLPNDRQIKILDCGCGNGWLTFELAKKYPAVEGADISSVLIQEAVKNYPHLNFTIADIEKGLPYKEQTFNAIILNMVLHNIENKEQVLLNLAKIIKPNGDLLVFSVNPYYAFPVGFWKRGLWDFLFFNKPRLQLNSYFQFLESKKNLSWTGKQIPLRFSPLPEQINQIINNGFKLKKIADLQADQDSKTFNFNYRLRRFPLIVVMHFEKN